MKLVKCLACLSLFLQPAYLLAAQELPPAQHFDTVSIRPTNPSDGSVGYNPDPNNFQAKGVDLRFLIQLAYDTNANDITGIAPAFRGLKFDLHAKSDVDPASPAAKLHYSSDKGKKTFEARLQSLLADRFQLKLHPATAERSVLNLEATKHVHLLPASKQNPMQSFSLGHLKFDSIDMDGFAAALTGQLMTNVIDRTGLPGVYAVEVKWQVPDSAEPLTFPFSIVNDALNDQLGLKLVPSKASIPILVVESATMPSPN